VIVSFTNQLNATLKPFGFLPAHGQQKSDLVPLPPQSQNVGPWQLSALQNSVSGIEATFKYILNANGQGCTVNLKHTQCPATYSCSCDVQDVQCKITGNCGNCCDRTQKIGIVFGQFPNCGKASAVLGDLDWSKMSSVVPQQNVQSPLGMVPVDITNMQFSGNQDIVCDEGAGANGMTRITLSNINLSLRNYNWHWAKNMQHDGNGYGELATSVVFDVNLSNGQVNVVSVDTSNFNLRLNTRDSNVMWLSNYVKGAIANSIKASLNTVLMTPVASQLSSSNVQ
jgi:hypothetical protein